MSVIPVIHPLAGTPDSMSVRKGSGTTCVENRCVGVHHWYCVYEVARDLAALQQVCRSCTECASDAWPLLAKCCDPECAVAPENATVKDLKRILRITPRELLEQAAKLKPDQLTVFRQLQLYIKLAG